MGPTINVIEIPFAGPTIGVGCTDGGVEAAATAAAFGSEVLIVII
jgi:hypothetical protein